MPNAPWRVLACSLTGAALAAASGLAWQLAPALSGGEIGLDACTLAALAALGAGTAGLVGGILTLTYERRLRGLHERPAAPPAPAAARRGALRARLSARGRWEAVSPELCRLLRRPARALRDQPMVDVVHPDDHAKLRQALRQAWDEDQPRTITCRLVVPRKAPSQSYARTTFRSDTKLLPPVDPAAVRYVRLRLRVRHAGPDGPAVFHCRLRDLTDRFKYHRAARQARQAVQQHQRRLRRVAADLGRLKESYRELYHNAPVMYFSLDVDGRLVTFNDTLIRTLGYQRDALARHSYLNLLAPGAAPPAGRAPFRDGEVETRWRSRTGAVLDVWIRTVAVLDEQGGFVRYRSAALDLTEKNRLANELRARGDELQRANDRLRTINSELEDFTYVVSHDLKEPLRTLQTYGHLLAEEYSAQLGADGFQYINHLIRASRRLGLLIDELLNLSQAGRITRSPQAFDLIEAVATARQDLADLIQRKEATVLTEGALSRVVGDRHRITQLLTNLIANGLKYNRSPQPQVVIAAGTATGPGGQAEVLVSVRDNGIGIDPAHHEQIFGIFRRLHQADEYEGTGAGLAICKKIVEGHGGRIWVESQPGAGATFFFTLPDIAAPSDDTPRTGVLPRSSDNVPVLTELATPPPSAPVEVADDGPRLVLVEDDPDTAHIIQRLGQLAGLTFTWFPSAEKAWVYLQEHCPDFLLFDIQLPGMSGVDLCRRVRTRVALRQTPVALFVRDQDPGRLAELRAAGADFFLNKDLLAKPAEWQARLQDLLEQGRRENSSTQGKNSPKTQTPSSKQ